MLARFAARFLPNYLAHAITQAVWGGGAAPSFTPDATFFAGASGFAYDPFDYSTMFQDSAGATPVTANWQSLGRINDLSGNGNNRTQAIAGKRPTVVAAGYQCDGSDDGMAGTADTSAGGNWTWIVRVDIGADASGVILRDTTAGKYMGVYQSGSPASVNDAGAGPLSSLISIDGGAGIGEDRGAFYTALQGGAKTVLIKLPIPTTWGGDFLLADYPSFEAGVTLGREILINRDLTGDDLTNAIAWVNN